MSSTREHLPASPRAIDATPRVSPTVRTVGSLVGLGAALVGVQIPVGPNLSLLSTACVLLALAIAVLRFPQRLLHARVSRVDTWFLIWIVTLFVIEAINSAALGHHASWGLLYYQVVAYLGAWAVRLVVARPADFVVASRSVTWPAIFVSVLALLQVLNIGPANRLVITLIGDGGLSQRVALNWDIRATSTIGHWTALGGYLIGIVAIAALGIVAARRAGASPRALWVVVCASMVGLASTFTFAVIIGGAAVVGALLVALGVRLRLIMGVAIVVAVVVLLLGGQLSQRLDDQGGGRGSSSVDAPAWVPQTVTFRLGVWRDETLPAIAERPLTGWGAGVYDDKAMSWPHRAPSLVWPSPESEWLRTLVGSGYIGLFAQLMAYGAAALTLHRHFRREGRPDLLVVDTFLGAVVLVSTFHSHLSNPGLLMPFWLLCGLALGMTQAKGPSQPAPRASSGRDGRRAS